MRRMAREIGALGWVALGLLVAMARPAQAAYRAVEAGDVADLSVMVAPELPCTWPGEMFEPYLLHTYVPIGPGPFATDLSILDEHTGNPVGCAAALRSASGERLAERGEVRRGGEPRTAHLAVRRGGVRGGRHRPARFDAAGGEPPDHDRKGQGVGGAPPPSAVRRRCAVSQRLLGRLLRPLSRRSPLRRRGSRG